MRLLLVDDDKENVNDIVNNFNKSYILDVAYSGVEGAYLSQVNEYDAILIDETLPDMDGAEVCRTTRSANVESPILLLLEHDKDVSYKVKSLDSGADSYISKPLDKEELSANIRALIRRKGSEIKNNYASSGPILIDLKLRQAYLENELLYLRRKEYDILQHLVVNKGKIVSKESLLEHIWEQGIYSISNTLEVHIRSLRKRLYEKYSREIIKTVRGFGYTISN